VGPGHAPLQGTLLGAAPPALADAVTFERVHLDRHSWVDVARGWLLGAETCFDHLVATVPWRQHRRRLFGEVVTEPRLSRWYRRDDPFPHPVFGPARAALTSRYGVRFGGFGLNYYRTGRDSVAWHRDTELRNLHRTLVAVITLGATRPFLVRPYRGGSSVDLRPGSGDLLVMGGRAQADWEHCVPKVAAAGPRISATMRWAAPPARRQSADSALCSDLSPKASTISPMPRNSAVRPTQMMISAARAG